MNHVDQGGAALAMMDLIKELAKKDEFQCVVVTGKHNRLNEQLDSLGIENYSSCYKNFMSSYKAPVIVFRSLLLARYRMMLPKAIRDLEHKIDFNSIDVIHSNLNRIDIGAILAQKYNIPHIWHVREHGEIDFKLMSIRKNPIRYMNSFPSVYVTISKSVRDIWIKRGLDKKRIKLIYDGIRTENFTESISRNLSKKTRFIFLGGYTINKGQEEAIDSLQFLPNDILNKIKLDFFGNGDTNYMEYLKEKVLKRGLASVVSINEYDPDIWNKSKNYDAGLTCSNAEGFGRVTVEYMMAGLCPIVSNTGANPEIVDNGVNGLVYQKGQPQDLANKIQFVVEHRSVAHGMGVIARNKAFTKFSMKKHADQIYSLYKELLTNTLR
ncbi:hypothetical protein BTI77_07490 [Lactobacillus delbrueckii subsp. bulgaricus]|nr:hypothetical protein [Lactobacillus delbrueckii subsp. bulgaricus]